MNAVLNNSYASRYNSPVNIRAIVLAILNGETNSNQGIAESNA
jgi:hypothetical protein